MELKLKYGERTPSSQTLDKFEADKDTILSQLEIFSRVCAQQISKAQERRQQQQSISKEDEKVEGKKAADAAGTAKAALNCKTSNPIEEKLRSSQPMGLFLTKIKDSPQTHRDARSIYITDLLHPSLGSIKKSLQINFMVEWEWLKMNYEVTKCQVKMQRLTYENF